MNILSPGESQDSPTMLAQFMVKLFLDPAIRGWIGSEEGIDAMKVVAQNRRARFELEILDTLEAGIVLQGSEVKSLRAGQCEMVDGFVRVEAGEAFMHKVRIAEYSHGGYSNHEPTRKRKLLVHKREANQLRVKMEEKGLTIVPLKIYFNEKGKVKVEIGIGRGKKAHDKRKATKDRETKREIDREMRRRR